jgi:hypothetical protein
VTRTIEINQFVPRSEIAFDLHGIDLLVFHNEVLAFGDLIALRRVFSWNNVAGIQPQIKAPLKCRA